MGLYSVQGRAAWGHARNMCRDRILPGPKATAARLLPASRSHRPHLPALDLPRAVSSRHALSPTRVPLDLRSPHPPPPPDSYILTPSTFSLAIPSSPPWRPHYAQIEPRMAWSLRPVLGRTHLPVRLGNPGHPARTSSSYCQVMGPPPSYPPRIAPRTPRPRTLRIRPCQSQVPVR